MPIQTTGTPLNGQEVFNLLLKNFRQFLESVPGLEMGRSYRQVSLKLKFESSCFPFDEYTKSPKFEFDFDVNSTEAKSVEGEAWLEEIKRLETVRTELTDKLTALNNFLDKVNPVATTELEMSTVINGEDKPDILRIEQGLPIPVVERVGGRSVEVYKDVTKTPGFNFGGKRK